MILNLPLNGRVDGRSVLVLLGGVIAGLVVTAVLMVQLLQAPMADISFLVWELAVVSVGSIGAGFCHLCSDCQLVVFAQIQPRFCLCLDGRAGAV